MKLEIIFAHEVLSHVLLYVFIEFCIGGAGSSEVSLFPLLNVFVNGYFFDSPWAFHRKKTWSIHTRLIYQACHRLRNLRILTINLLFVLIVLCSQHRLNYLQSIFFFYKPAPSNGSSVAVVCMCCPVPWLLTQCGSWALEM